MVHLYALIICLLCSTSQVVVAFSLQRSPPTQTSTFSLQFPLTQVVSDIDDTLKSSGGVSVAGVNLGGIDVQV